MSTSGAERTQEIFDELLQELERNRGELAQRSEIARKITSPDLDQSGDAFYMVRSLSEFPDTNGGYYTRLLRLPKPTVELRAIVSYGRRYSTDEDNSHTDWSRHLLLFPDREQKNESFIFRGQAYADVQTVANAILAPLLLDPRLPL